MASLVVPGTQDAADRDVEFIHEFEVSLLHISFVFDAVEPVKAEAAVR